MQRCFAACGAIAALCSNLKPRLAALPADTQACSLLVEALKHLTARSVPSMVRALHITADRSPLCRQKEWQRKHFSVCLARADTVQPVSVPYVLASAIVQQKRTMSSCAAAQQLVVEKHLWHHIAAHGCALLPDHTSIPDQSAVSSNSQPQARSRFVSIIVH